MFMGLSQAGEIPEARILNFSPIQASTSATFGTLEGLAIMLGLFRLAFRLKIRRFWWEDMWAAVVVVCGLSFIVATVVYYESQSHQMIHIAVWISSYAFTSTVWAVRMSLLYSIIRIIWPATHLRNISRVIALVFLSSWATLIALKTFWCMSNTKVIFSRPTCRVSNMITIFEVTADCIADTSLVALALKRLWRVKLPRRQRRMILCLFSSTAIMSVLSLAHATGQLLPITTIQDYYILTQLEFLISLIVCNLLVVVTYLYRVTRCSPDEECSDSESSTDDDFTTPTPTSTQYFTTVNLSTFVLTPWGTQTESV